MKQILTIISLLHCISTSAQDTTPLDKIFDEMSAITSVPRTDIKQKINHGVGVVMYVHNHPVGKEFLCSEECGSAPYPNMTTEETIQANERNKKVFDGIFNAIGRNLDSLMTVAEESYHYENSDAGIDTIQYSICIKNGKDAQHQLKATDGTMIFPDALETVSLNFTTSKKPCGKHVRGFGILSYNKNVYLPGRKSYDFNKEPYLKKITPVLKRKGITAWGFKWATSADYDLDSHWREEFYSGETLNLKTADGKKSNAGQTTGTMYFIPRENKALAAEIFTAIDSITLRHTEEHPEQMFSYAYNIKELIMQYADENVLSSMFSGSTVKIWGSTRVLFGITPKGYYVAVADVENNFCIPKEWYKLKSFADGKKKYVKY